MSEAREYLRTDGGCPFRDHFVDLADASAKARIDTTFRKLEQGLTPDVKSVGGGVHEVRIEYGPGCRLYCRNDGVDLAVLRLCGDKRTQDEASATAKTHWADYRARKAAPPPKEGHPQPPPRLRPTEEQT